MGQSNSTTQGNEELENRTFEYAPLCDSEIRLFRIGDPDDDLVSCELLHVDLASKPAYYALSYVWGNEKDNRPIRINGQRFQVTANLLHALKSIRNCKGKLHDRMINDQEYSERSRTHRDDILIWADAICIDQNNEREKPVQIPRMNIVYSMAYCTIISINMDAPDQDTVEWAFQTMFTRGEEGSLFTDAGHFNPDTIHELILRDVRLNNALDPHGITKLVFVFQQFLGNPWFKRLWVVQEFILSHQSPVVLLGFDVPLFVLDDISSICEAIIMLGKPAKDPSLEQKLELFDGVIGLIIDGVRVITRLSTLKTSIMQMKARGDTTAQVFLQALLSTEFRKATIVHDHIYGLLGLLPLGTLPDHLEVNYGEPVAQVFRKCAAYVFQETGNLFLLEAASGTCSDNTPSWVPDISRYPGGVGIYTPGQVTICNGALNVQGVNMGRPSAIFISESFDKLTVNERLNKLRQFRTRILQPAASISGCSLQETLDRKLFARQNPYTTKLFSKFSADFVGQRLEEVKADWAQAGVQLSMAAVGSILHGKSWLLMNDGSICNAQVRGSEDKKRHHEVWALKGSKRLSILQSCPAGYHFAGFIYDTTPARSSKLDEDFFKAGLLKDVVII